MLAGIDDALYGWEDAAVCSPARLPDLSTPATEVAGLLSARTGIDGYAATVIVADALEWGDASPWYAEVSDAAAELVGAGGGNVSRALLRTPPLRIADAVEIIAAPIAAAAAAMVPAMAELGNAILAVGAEVVDRARNVIVTTVTVDPASFLTALTKAAHRIDSQADPRRHRRCRICRPRGFPPPLAIDGRAYRRRQLARRRRHR